MNYSSRFWLYAPIGAFLLIAAAVMIHWWIAAGAFEKKLAALKGHAAAPGIVLDWSGATVGGFPFRIDAAFTGFAVHGAGAHGAFSWNSEKFALHTLTYSRDKIVYEAAGRQDVDWHDAGGKAHWVSFLPAAVHASTVGNAKGLSRFDLDIIGAGGPDLTAGRLQFHMRRDPDGKDIDLMVSADAVKTAVLSFKSLQAYSTVTNGAAFAGLLQGRQSWPEAAAAWKAQGGAIKPGQSDGVGAVVAGGLLGTLY